MACKREKKATYESVNMARDVAEATEQDVDEEVTAASGDERCCCGREEDGHENQDDITGFDHFWRIWVGWRGGLGREVVVSSSGLIG